MNSASEYTGDITKDLTLMKHYLEKAEEQQYHRVRMHHQHTGEIMTATLKSDFLMSNEHQNSQVGTTHMPNSPTYVVQPESTAVIIKKNDNANQDLTEFTKDQSITRTIALKIHNTSRSDDSKDEN